MAGVFKNLDASDIRLTPFQTHKKWNDAVCYDNYSAVNSTPESVSGLFNISDRAFANYNTLNQVRRLDSSDQYTLLSSYTIPNLSGSKYGIDTAQNYVAAFGTNTTNATVTMLSSLLTLATSGSYTSSVVTIPFDLSYNVSASLTSFVYVAGKGGVSAKMFNTTTGAFSGSEHTITNLANQSLTSSFYAINAEGKTFNDRVLAISVTGSNAYAVTFSGSFGGNTLIAAGSSSIGSTAGVLPKTFLYSKTQDLYLLLMNDGYLYKITPNATASFITSGVSDILQNQSNYVSGSNSYQDTKIHVVYTSGQVGLDFNVVSAPGSFEVVVDARQWVASKPIVKATIQSNNPSGSIGIFAGATSSLGESVFFTINPFTYEKSDPIHMGSTKGDLRISGTNLKTFLGFNTSYNSRFVQFNTNASIFQHYKADYNPQPSHPSPNPLNILFDQGNPTFQYYEPITANGKFQRVVHSSIDHLYYRHFYDNTKASFGSGNINTQNRFLEDQAQIINLPQTRFGEAIQQGSIIISANYTVSQSANNALTIVDDLYGNLYVSGGYVSSVNGSTLITGSVSASTAGEWPTLDTYKYATKGPCSFFSTLNKGNWQMRTEYTNMIFGNIAGTTPPIPQSIDLLGVVPIFSSSLSSSITIKPDSVPEYKQSYNFENGDFTITMMIKASATSSNSSGSVIIAKQGSEEDTAVDINGNTYTYLASNRTPYRVRMDSNYKIIFERDNLMQQVSVSGSLTQDKLHHVTTMKTGSQLRVYVDGILHASGSDVEIVKGCSNKGNITIGNLYTQDRGFDGIIDNVKIYNKALTTSDIFVSYHTLGVNDTIIGNVFYNQGQMVLGAVPTRFMDISNVVVRGTHTIWEKEITCTIGAGEFNRSNNPTLQVYNPASNQYEFRPFTTGSFKPYITTVGLYDEFNQMLAVAKLATPIQLPDNVDTSIVIRYDN